MSQRVVRVSSLMHYLKGKLDSDKLIQNLLVQGEISNFTPHRSGHWYFTLKDEQSRISCVMFQSYAKQCQFMPKNGDQIILQANTSIFESGGSLQLYGIKMQLDGQGDLHQQFERLKRKLNEEGLFAKEHKKMIPQFPMKIGLVTGKNTAAREDVVSTLSRRWPCAKIVEFYTLVQGEGAPQEICEALQEADLSMLDVILLVRGGGSLEDLWAFNSEIVARQIYSMKTPVIAGIGHEIDVTIADYVADLRAATPTGAAELAAPVLEDVLEMLQKNRTRLSYACNKKMMLVKKEFMYLQSSTVFLNPERLFEQKWMHLHLMEEMLFKTNEKLIRLQNELTSLKGRMSLALKNRTMNTHHRLNEIKETTKMNMERKMRSAESQFVKQAALLDAYSPLKSLSRGYILSYVENHLVDSVDMIDIGQQVELRFKDGFAKATVVEKEINHG